MPRKKIEDIPAHFFSKVNKEGDNGCWLWMGSIHRKGYGQISVNGTEFKAHRWCYEYHKGPLPEGLLVGHACKNRLCVNPEHLIATYTSEIGASAYFFLKVSRDTSSECWEWTGGKTGAGYGAFSIDGKFMLAHRWSYEHHKGPIPGGLELDHLCRNRACVNPGHMEPVAHKENLLRGTGICATNARKTYCPRGHLYNKENTYVRSSRGGRECRACWNERYREKGMQGVPSYVET